MNTELGMDIESRAPKVKPHHIDRLIAELRLAKRPMLAAELAQIMFGKSTETAKRRVRAIASAAFPRVMSSPGSDGYDLWARVKIDDLWRCVYEIEDASRTLMKKAVACRRALHSGYRGEPGDNGQGDLFNGACQPAIAAEQSAAS